MTRAALAWILVALVAALFALAWYATRAEDGSNGGARLARNADAFGAPSSELEVLGSATARDGVALARDPFMTSAVDVTPSVRLAGDGRLTGRVLDRATGEGIAGLRVDLLPNSPSAIDVLGSMLRMARTAGGMERRSLAVAVTVSGPGGTFAFEGVRSGTYFLDARGPWHVPDHMLRARVAPSGAGGPSELFVRLGGRVLGQVLLPDGTPAAGAALSLFPGPGVVLKRFRSGELRRLDLAADAEGRFAFAGVTPGEGYVLHAVGRGFAVSHLALPPVKPGEDQEVTLTTRPGGVITGRVLALVEGTEEPTPLEGVQVAVLPQGLRDLTFAEEVLEATFAITDGEGRYRLRDVPPGVLEVLAVDSAAEYVSGHTPRLEVAADLELAAPDIVLVPGPVLAGRVVDAAGAPISGVHVRWFMGEVANPQSFDFTFAALMHQAVGDFEFPLSDADGRFRAGPFPGEPPYLFYLAKSGYPYTRAEWFPERDGSEQEFVMAVGGSVSGVVVDGESGAPVTSFTISGQSRIDQDFAAPSSFNPFSGGQLVENPEGAFHVPAVRPGRIGLGFEAAGYHKHVIVLEMSEGAVFGNELVELTAGGTVSGKVLDTQGEPVPGAEVSILGDGGEWSIAKTFGRVAQHAGTGGYRDTEAENVTNMLISFATRMGSMAEGAVTSGPDGSYALESVQAGEYAVIARHRDFSMGKSVRFTLGHGENRADVAVVMKRGAGLYGTVTDRYGRPVAEAVLVAVSPTEFSGDHSAGAAAYQGVSDEFGNYSIEHMSGGSYLFSVVRGDAALDPMSFASTLQFDLVYVPVETRVRYDVVDRSAAACRVFGEVTSGDKPVTNGGIVAVSFEAENVLGLDAKATRVRTDATYEFPGLAPGHYQFVYQGSGSELRIEADVPDAPEFELDLELPWGGVAGRVVAADTGQPLSRSRVRLVREGQGELDSLVAMLIYARGVDERQRTGADGEFRFLGHQEGRYLIEATPPRGRSEYAPAEVFRVDVREGEVTKGIEIALPRALTVAGIVLGPAGPVDRARVVAVDAGGRLAPGSDRTGADGRFELDTLGPGSFELVATAEGLAEGRSAMLELGEEPVDEVVLHLEAGIELTVHVVGHSGEPISGALATVFDQRGRPVASELPDEKRVMTWFSKGLGSDSDGRLFVGRFRPGVYRVEVWRGSARTTLEGVELEAGAPREVEARLDD